MPSRMFVTIESGELLGMTTSAYNRIMRDGMREGVGKPWKRRHLERHFLRSAYRRYSKAYRPRSGESGSGRAWQGSYSHRKLLRRTNGQGVRAIGEVKPLVWSGRSRAAAKSAWDFATQTVRSGEEFAVHVKLHARTLNLVRPRGNTKINAYNELHARSPDEDQILATGWASYTDSEFQKRGRRSRTKIRI